MKWGLPKSQFLPSAPWASRSYIKARKGERYRWCGPTMMTGVSGFCSQAEIVVVLDEEPVPRHLPATGSRQMGGGAPGQAHSAIFLRGAHHADGPGAPPLHPSLWAEAME